MTCRLFIITGDYSGDVHAANVVRALRERQPEIQIAAVGGENLRAADVELLSDQSQMGRVGFGGVLGAPYHYWLGQRILNFLEDFRPDAVLLIDYGGFNLYMAARLKQRGYRTLYFIPPQVWASRRGRIRKIKAHVDHVFCIFPFEEALYQSHGIPVTYVGHPLIGQLPPPADRTAFCARHGLDPARPIAALLPGSRKLEIDYLLDIIIGSLPLIRAARPDVQFVLAQAPSLSGDQFQVHLEKAWRQLPDSNIGEKPPLTLVQRENHALLSVADAAILASGTATLEAALYGAPMAILYKLHPLVHYVAIRLLYLPCIGLPNILTDMENPIVPELLQYEATPERLRDAFLPLLAPDSLEVRRQKAGFARIREVLDRGDAPERVAEGILQLISRK